MRAAGCGADDRAESQAADHARCNSATIARFSRLRGSDGRESKGRGGRKGNQGSGLCHGAPSFGSLRSYAFNDCSVRFLRISAQHQRLA
jgi:hypothetical protein